MFPSLNSVQKMKSQRDAIFLDLIAECHPALNQFYIIIEKIPICPPRCNFASQCTHIRFLKKFFIIQPIFKKTEINNQGLLSTKMT